MTGRALEAQIADGTAKVDGGAGILKPTSTRASMPGAKSRTFVADEDRHEANPRQPIAE